MIRPAAAATLTQRRLPVETGMATSRRAAREAEHPRGLAEMRQPVENPGALGVEHGVVEDGVGFGKGDVAQAVGVGGQAGERVGARVAAGDVGERVASSWSARRARGATNASAVSRSIGTWLSRTLILRLPTALAASESPGTGAPAPSPGSCPSPR